MSTKRETEARHRWTPQEENKLLDLAKPFETVSEAADEVYVKMSMPRQAVYGKLYELRLRGAAPWLSLKKEKKAAGPVSPAFIRAIRELVRTMRIDHISVVLVSAADPVTVEIQRASETLTVEM